MSKSKTISALKKINTELEELFERLDLEDEVKLSTQIEGKWSPLQIMQHLKTSEELSLSYIQYNIGKAKVFPSLGLKHHVKSVLLNLWLASNFKMTAPQQKGLSPSNEGLDYQKIKDHWKIVRTDLTKYLGSIEESYYDQAVFKHIFVDRMGLHHMVKFFEAHFKRHRKQLFDRLDRME